MKIYGIAKHPWFGIEGLTTLAYRMGVVKLKIRPVMLVGIYFQAAMQQKFEVEFERIP